MADAGNLQSHKIAYLKNRFSFLQNFEYMAHNSSSIVYQLFKKFKF